MANSCIPLGHLKADYCTNTIVVHLLRFANDKSQLLVSALKAGRCTETVVTRHVRFPDARIQPSSRDISRHRLNIFQQLSKEGAAYELSLFETSFVEIADGINRELNAYVLTSEPHVHP
ncbi:hypothetical protein YC2023_060321 [Brassica napus]